MAIKLKKTTQHPAHAAKAVNIIEPKVVDTLKIDAGPAAIIAVLEPPQPLPVSFLSVGQAAAYAGVSPITIRRWIKTKAFLCHRAGKQWKIDPKELVSFMRRSAHC